MGKQYLYFLGILLFSVNLFAQDNKAIKDAILELTWRADSLAEIDSKAAIATATRAYLWAKDIEDSALVADASYTLGYCLYFVNQLDSAEKLLLFSLKYYTQVQDTFSKSYAYYCLADVNFDKGKYAKALRYLYASLDEERLLGNNSSGEMYTLQRMADIHAEQGDYALAEEKYRTAFTIADAENFNHVKLSCLIGICAIMIRDNRIEETKPLLKMMRALHTSGESVVHSIYAKRVFAYYYSAIGNYKKAIAFADSAVDIATKFTDPYLLVEAKLVLGNVHLQAGNLSTAKIHGSDAYSIAQTQPGYYLQKSALQLLGVISEASGLYKDALYYNRLFHNFEDSIAADNIQDKILANQLKQSKREETLLRREAELSQKVISRDNTLKIMLAALALVSVILILLATIASLKLRKKNASLSFKNREIAAQQHLIAKANVQLKLANDTLNKQNKNKDKVFSILSHDLREPFNQLIGLLEIMENQDSLDKETLDMLIPKITESAHSAHNSVVNLLFWSKNQLTEIKTEKTTFVLKDLIENVKRSLLLTAERKGIRLMVKYAPDLTLYADYYQVEIALRNILTNAIKFSPKDGVIHINTSTEKNQVILSVTDNGKGISEAQITKIYSETLDGDSTVGTFNERGTGLGLNIVNDFVQANGGTLQIKSKVNFGSTFSLNFPKV